MMGTLPPLLKSRPRSEVARSAISAYSDGAAAPNPGHGAYGFVVFVDGSVVEGEGRYIGESCTNNEAEYRGVIGALRAVKGKVVALRRKNDGRDLVLRVYTDSQLVERQLNGRYEVRSAPLVPLHAAARALMDEMPALVVEHVLRDRNALADALAKRASESRADCVLSTQISELARSATSGSGGVGSAAFGGDPRMKKRARSP